MGFRSQKRIFIYRRLPPSRGIVDGRPPALIGEIMC